MYQKSICRQPALLHESGNFARCFLSYVYKFPMPVLTVCPRYLLFSAEQFQADSQAAQEDDS